MTLLYITYSTRNPDDRYETKDIIVKRKHIPREGELLEAEDRAFKVKTVLYTERSEVKLFCEMI